MSLASLLSDIIFRPLAQDSPKVVRNFDLTILCKTREKGHGLAREWHINQKKKIFFPLQNFLSNGNKTQTGLGHQILIDQKGRIEFRKETILKAGIEFFIRRAKFRQTAWHQDFFAVSLKIVWDPDWWPAKAFATVLCGKPSPCNIRYSSIKHGIFSPTVSSNTAAEVKGF